MLYIYTFGPSESEAWFAFKRPYQETSGSLQVATPDHAEGPFPFSPSDILASGRTTLFSRRLSA